jgi:hypothetical protein
MITHLPLAGIFPIVATSIFMGVVVKYDAAQPSDGTHCACLASNFDQHTKTGMSR